MTTAAPAFERSAALAPGRGYPSRAVEFLLTGGATLLLFPCAWLLRLSLGLEPAELAVGFVMFHAAHLINDPHFSVTYLLFYRDAQQRALGDAFSRGQRIRYWLAGFVAPLALAVWVVLGLADESARTLGWLIQLMFLLVGWHYVKQGFGVLTVLSARRGLHFSSLERRALLTHCFAGWAYAWASPAAPGRLASEKGVVYRTVSHPVALEQLAWIAFALSAVLLAAMLLRKWRREGRLPPLAPLSGFLITVWLWTVYSSIDPLMVYVIPALHSLQYLYFVWLLRRNEARAAEGPPHFGRPTALRLGLLAATALGLGWLLFHGAPGFVDEIFIGRAAGATSKLGATPFFAAIFAFVNIHHYLMDAVLWRRENPDTRFLRS